MHCIFLPHSGIPKTLKTEEWQLGIPKAPKTEVKEKKCFKEIYTLVIRDTQNEQQKKKKTNSHLTRVAAPRLGERLRDRPGRVHFCTRRASLQ
jgi:hypothetical protein